MLNTLGPVPFTPLLSAIITPGPQQIDFHCRPIAIGCQAGAGRPCSDLLSVRCYDTNKLGQLFLSPFRRDDGN